MSSIASSSSIPYNLWMKEVVKCVLGIGGSAGALEAYQQFIKAIPNDVNAAIIIVQHMDPSQKSLLPELLSHKTKLPVHSAQNGLILKSNNIYIMAPGTCLTLQGSTLAIREIQNDQERRYPIDIFFASLASQFGNRAVGIVVSGTGNDGTNGLKLIKQAGGRTLVQDPAEAKFDGMPQSAINAGVVDQVLSAEQIAKIISSFVECSFDDFTDFTDQEEILSQICNVLESKTGHDFSGYKKSTIFRRIERRVQANSLTTLKEYLKILKDNFSESQTLLKDLLISVTQFFRDPEVFESLKTDHLPGLFESIKKGEALRVWVPACATGEEAYTIAILLKEYSRLHKLNIPLQIFATDIDRLALETARTGLYPEATCATIPGEYLKRYFKKDEAGYRVNVELREICIFSEHSLLKNPPFSRIDLISCRNLFIYWEPELQLKTLPVFHYSLNPGKILLLGPAENISGNSELFKAIDKKNRIFRRNDILSREHLYFPISSLKSRSSAVLNETKKLQSFSDKDISKNIIASLLEGFAPPAFVISQHGEILFYSGRTGKFLEPPTGAPSSLIYDVVLKAIRPELHALVYKCIKSGTEVYHPSLTYENEGVVQKIKLTVKPMPEMAEDSHLYLVILQEMMAPKTKEEALKEGLNLSTPDSIVAQLEVELKDTREHLQNTNEEVKSSNEELLSMNEELQSANEELQTSKEELQSTNEEIQTVNSELSSKIEQLDATNSDLQNFFNSAHIPIIFLDRDFKIQRFTPSATKVFRLIPGDLGRGITDITSHLNESDFTAEFKSVLINLQPIEREISSLDGKTHYLMKISPYRTVNELIAGVIATFSDITEVKRAQETQSTLAAIVENSTDAIISRDFEGRITSWNKAAEKLLQFTEAEALGRPVTLIVPPEHIEEFQKSVKAVQNNQPLSAFATTRVRKDGFKIPVISSMFAIINAQGKMMGFSVILKDVTEQTRIEENLKKSHQQLVDSLESMSDCYFALDSDWRILRVNSNQEAVSKIERSETIGKFFWDVFPEARKTLYWTQYHQVMKERTPVHFEDYYAPLEIWTEVDAYPSSDGGISVFFRDVTEQKKNEQTILETNEKLKSLPNAMPNLAWMAHPDGYIYWYNERWYEYTGTTPESMAGWGWQSVHDPEILPAVMAEWQAAIKEGKPCEITFPIKGKDGKYRWFLTRMIPLKNANNEIVQWFGTNTDVDELRKARVELQQAVSARDEFLSIASHELKTPLTTLKLQSQLRKKRLSKNDETAFTSEKLNQMFTADERQINRLSRLIDDMLDITRIGSGKLIVNPEHVDLKELFKEVIHRFEDQLEAAGCKIHFEYTGKTDGNWDRYRLEQVITNLLTNAMKYGPGKPIHIILKRENDKVVFNFIDEGMGIDIEDHERIFKQFERAINVSEVSGLGLGLYIVKQILEAHNGTIRVESEKGEGSRFTVELPV